MRRYAVAAVILVLAMLAAGCGRGATPEEPGETTAVPTELRQAAPSKQEALSCSAQYIRTPGDLGDRTSPQVTVIRSRFALEAYYEAHQEQYFLEGRESVASDTTVGFWDACRRYDDAFFQDHELILAVLEEPSGSIRHRVTALTREGADRMLTVTRLIPECGTDDMAQWHLIVETERTEGGEVLITLSDAPCGGIACLQTPYAAAQVPLPQGWSGTVSLEEPLLRLWPEGQEGDVPERSMELRFWRPQFGVCGTGLTERQVTLANGVDARLGYYDGSPVWYFALFQGLAGSYAALNCGLTEEEASQALSILKNALLAPGFLTEAEAVRLARQVCTLEFDRIDARFRWEDRTWTVDFLGLTPGGDETVLLDNWGEVLQVTYGE